MLLIHSFKKYLSSIILGQVIFHPGGISVNRMKSLMKETAALMKETENKQIHKHIAQLIIVVSIMKKIKSELGNQPCMGGRAISD